MFRRRSLSDCVYKYMVILLSSVLVWTIVVELYSAALEIDLLMASLTWFHSFFGTTLSCLCNVRNVFIYYSRSTQFTSDVINDYVYVEVIEQH